MFILGGGPSLAEVDLEQLRGRRLIVINRTFRLAPWADVLYFCDRGWWARDGAEVERTFAGRIFTVAQLPHPRLHNLMNTGHAGIELEPTGLRHGTNSGYQAINLALHLGCRRAVLLGYDMRTVDGRTHAHGGYGLGEAQVQHVLQTRMLPYFPAIVAPLAAAGLEVLNATDGSALDCFPKVSLRSILSDGDTIAGTGENAS